MAYAIIPRNLTFVSGESKTFTYGEPITLDAIDIKDKDAQGNEYSRAQEMIENGNVTYTITYKDSEGNDVENPTNVGTYYAIYSFASNNKNYVLNSETSGKVSTQFTIIPKNVDKESLTVKGLEDHVYDGKEYKPTPEVYDGETKLVEGTDYDVVYTTNKDGVEQQVETAEDFVNVKTVYVVITPKGNYASESPLVYSYNITQKDINDSTITVNKPSDVKYDGKEHKFVPEVKDSETESTLVEGTDYTVSY